MPQTQAASAVVRVVQLQIRAMPCAIVGASTRQLRRNKEDERLRRGIHVKTRWMSQRFAYAASVAAATLVTANIPAHDDLAGTRFVAPQGTDQGDCDERDTPCRTLRYATGQLHPGDAIKLAEGTYDLSGLDIESLLGKEGIRGGYTVEDEFHVQNEVNHPTRLRGVDPQYRNSLVAHGFIVLDANGEPVPAPPLQKITVPTACANGLAGTFACWNVDFLAQVDLSEFSTGPASASNLWGFVDRNDNREYAVVGHRNGTTVFDVTNPASPREVGTVAGILSAWREVKVYQSLDAVSGRYRAYAYISTEGPTGGLQVIDLTGLPNSVALANTIRDIDTSHTLYVSNVSYADGVPLAGHTAFLYLAGANVNGGAFRIYDLADPVTPRLVTSAPVGTGYMHDSTSVLITDNRTTQCAGGHNPCEVLVDFNVESVDLWDVTDKAAPVKLSATTFPTATFVHSGWWTEDKQHVIVHDELDELRRGINTQIYTLDIGDLRTPSMVTSYTGPTTTTDHNGYAIGNRYYMSHYKRGLVIFDITNPSSLVEMGSFDTYQAPAANSAGTDGAWGVYPFLPSGTLLVSDIEHGLFLLKRNETMGPPPPPVVTPAPSPTPPSSSGGGGGALDVLGLLVLACLMRIRRRDTHVH
jgi:choice-of-anchor B domain-containing protein